MKFPTSFNPYMAFAKKNSGWIIIAVIAIGVAIYIYFKGKRDGKIYIPDGWNPNTLADKLYKVMNDTIVASGTKDAAWKELLGLATDDMIIAVYNTFNKKYATKGKGSLTEWVNDEIYYDYLSGVKSKLYNKLKSLRLN
jgi:hypothetical protein